MPPLSSYRVHSLSRSFRERADATLRTIEELPKMGACVVSTSWGKDSVVLADLCLQAWGSADLVFKSFPHRLPGYEPVIEHFTRQARVNYSEVTTGMDLRGYLDFWGEIGLPHDIPRSRHAAAVSAIKKDVLSDWIEGRGYSVTVLGMRAAENPGTRGMLFRTRGLVYPKGALTHANPLGWWTARDVWAYIYSRQVPYLPLYDLETHGETRETLRNTGWLSTDGSSVRGRAAWLRFHFPDQWLALCREFPEMNSYA